MAINAQDFLNALDEIEATKGISRDQILVSLREAMAKGFRKQLGGDDANVVVNIDPEKGILEMYQIKDIVEDIEDDFLQVSMEDAKEIQKSGVGKIVGNELHLPASIEDLRKATAMSIKSILKQKFAEAEKDLLYEAFKDKIGTMITGKVERFDEHGCSVNIGKTSVYLPKNQLIGDEAYRTGDPIRIYVNSVEATSKGARIVVTRSNDGFLKTLFNEEIREIYDGTIVIKGIAREAGERSKVSVFTSNVDIDPAGACIGQNGARIQKIVSQLGNGNSKEKIDIIAYSDNPGLYVMESLKPAQVIGVNYDEEKRTATAVVKDDSLSLAIGKRGVNVRLAARLTGYSIDIKIESDAIAEGFEFSSFEELNAMEMERRQHALEEQRKKEALLAMEASKKETVLPGLPEGYVAPQERVYEQEAVESDLDEALEEVIDKEEIVAPVSEKVEVVETPKEETKAVKTTTTISDLEKSLEEDAAKAKAKTARKSNTHKAKKEEEETEASEKKADTSTRMSIYTEEELRQFEEEDKENEEEIEDEDIDYDEYDEYYDDEK